MEDFEKIKFHVLEDEKGIHSGDEEEPFIDGVEVEKVYFRFYPRT